MIACPACKRRVVSQRDILNVRVDGHVKCPACGQLARLDSMSRCCVGCIVALLLFMTLLHGGFFYSHYLFLISTVFILGCPRILAAAALPLLTLERAPGSTRFTRRQNLATLGIMMVVAVAIDGLMSYRSPADNAYAAAAPATPHSSPE